MTRVATLSFLLGGIFFLLTGCNSFVSFNRKEEVKSVEQPDEAASSVAIDSVEPEADEIQLTQRIEDKKAELKKYNDLVLKLKRYESQLKEEQVQLKKRIEVLATEKQKAQAAVDVIVKTQKAKKAKAQAEIDALVVTQKAEKAKTEKLEIKNDKLITQNKILMKHLENTQKTVRTLSDKRNAQRAVLAELKTKINQNKKELTSMILEQKSLFASIKKLKANQVKLQAMSSNFVTTRQKLQQDLKRLQQTINNFDDWELFAAQKVAARKNTALAAQRPRAAAPVKAGSLKCNVSGDAFLLQKASDKNMGPHNGLAVGFDKKYGELISVMKFDLAAIPRNKKVKKVILKCYCKNHTGAQRSEVVVHQVVSPWKEKKVNWKNIQYSKGPIAGTVLNKPEKWYAWDITPLFQQWTNTGNNGLALKLGPDNGKDENYFLIGSKESNSFSPFIEVELEK